MDNNHLIFHIPLCPRAAVATALAGLCFLGGGELAEVVATMEVRLIVTVK